MVRPSYKRHIVGYYTDEKGRVRPITKRLPRAKLALARSREAKIQEALRRVKENIKDVSVTPLKYYLVGSFARGMETPQSDLDIYVQIKEKLSVEEANEVGAELWKRTGYVDSHKVDVTVGSEPPFAYAIELRQR